MTKKAISMKDAVKKIAVSELYLTALNKVAIKICMAKMTLYQRVYDFGFRMTMTMGVLRGKEMYMMKIFKHVII